MRDEIDLLDDMRRLASLVPREASPHLEQKLAAAFRARRRRPTRVWVYVVAAAILLLSLTRWHKDSPPRQSYTFNARGFIALPYSQSGVPLESVVVMRVQMRPSEWSSIGVAVPSASTGPFTADLLIGQDGVARAVRFVQ
jgi:hypothetical protein